MKVTGSRTPKIREQERKAAKRWRSRGAVHGGSGMSGDWDHRGTAATGERDRRNARRTSRGMALSRRSWRIGRERCMPRVPKRAVIAAAVRHCGLVAIRLRSRLVACGGRDQACGGDELEEIREF